MHGPEVVTREGVKGLAVATLAVLGGVALKNEAVKAGFSRPLALAIGVGAAIASVIAGPHILDHDLQARSASEPEAVVPH